ncbi:MAG: DUF72 domain-containing protein [Bryobacter sp.]|nr:DUF72 domain-containing protein [Bryobacter sp.]
MKLIEEGSLHIGPAGWDRGTGSYRRLEKLAERYGAAEISSSEDGPLPTELARMWVKVGRQNPHLRFAARAWQRFTHEPGFSERDAQRFRQSLSPLLEAGQLGAVHLAFPSGFRFQKDTREKLIATRRALAGLPLVAEFPHQSWSSEEALGTLIDFHIGFSNLDQYQHARAMPPTAFLTSPVGYVRFRGRNAPGPQTMGPQAAPPYRYCAQELEGWAHRIRKVNRFAKMTFVVFTGFAEDAEEMAQLLGKAPQWPRQVALFPARAA